MSMKLSFAVKYLFAAFALPGLAACGGGGAEDSGGDTTPGYAPILSTLSAYDSFGQSRDVLIDGEYIYTADGTVGLVVVQATPEGQVDKLEALQFSDGGRASHLAKNGNILYMASQSAGIWVINVSNPAVPTLVTEITASDEVVYVERVGDFLYASAKNYFVIYDISTADAPVFLGELELSSPNQNIKVVGDYAYVAAYNKGLRVIDIRAPAAPSLVLEIEAEFNARAIEYYDGHIYIGGNGALKSYDISNPESPELIGGALLSANRAAAAPNDFYLWKNFLFVSSGVEGVYVVDIRNPESPKLETGVLTLGEAQSVSVSGRRVAIAVTFGGVQFVDLFETTDRDGDGFRDGEDLFPDDPAENKDSDNDGTGDNADQDDDNDGRLDGNDEFPFDPKEWSDGDSDEVGDNSDTFPSDPAEWEDLDLDGVGDNADNELALEMTGISVLDTRGQSRDMAKSGDLIYLADGIVFEQTGGVDVMQVDQDGSMTKVGGYEFIKSGDISIRSVVRVEDYLYAASRIEGLLVLDLSNDPLNPQLVNTIDTPDKATFIKVIGDRLYLSDRTSLRIYDITTRSAPVEIGVYDAPFVGLVQSEIERVYIDGDIAYVAAYYTGLRVLDISDPANIVQLKQVSSGGFAYWAIEKRDNYLFIGGEGSGLLVYDVATPSLPVLVASITLPSEADPKPADQPPFKMQAYGNYLFVADGYSGIQAVNIANPLQPFIETSFETPGYTWGFHIDGYTLLVADTEEGVQLVNLGTNLDHDADSTPNYLDQFPLDATQQ
ncbi:MAG: hypothetical protein GY814_17725 [Gammaproteobacteria bacterium]|nr:hypothetical protein [Gammaproteobacteria bacterium]